MGLDQNIYKQDTKVYETRNSHWLHKRLLPLGAVRLNKNINELNTEYIPITTKDIQGIINDAEEVINAKSTNLLNSYFKYETNYNTELECIIEEMNEFIKTFNKINNKEDNYYYWSWW